MVTEAYRLWLTYDSRTDDITMIVLSIQDYVSVQEGGISRLPSNPITTLFSRARGVLQEEFSPKGSHLCSLGEEELALALAERGEGSMAVAFVESKPVRRTANKVHRYE